MSRRLTGSLIVFLSILIFPYWIYIPVLCVAVIVFPFFWEGILLAMFIDFIYGSGIESFSALLFSVSFYILILLILLVPLRTRIRSYV